MHDLAGEATLATRGDHQPAARVGGIGLRMARRTERHQAVEIEVRAALGALDDPKDEALAKGSEDLMGTSHQETTNRSVTTFVIRSWGCTPPQSCCRGRQ